MKEKDVSVSECHLLAHVGYKKNKHTSAIVGFSRRSWVPPTDLF